MAVVELEREAGLLFRVQHPNIVRLYGIVAEGTALCAILELMPGGNLYNFLHDRAKRPPSVELSVALAIDVFAAVEFLHAQRPPIAHRDLKAKSVYCY